MNFKISKEGIMIMKKIDDRRVVFVLIERGGGCEKKKKHNYTCHNMNGA